MECNRSEAARCLEMAVQKFTSQEYIAARKLALKAQQLFPSLDNIAQTIAVFDVHAAAQTRIGINEKDWYGILQIEPTADDAVVKKQYRKLALFLHPDKNKAIGAESAFKLIGEALQVLSDKVKRLVYDAKRGMHARATNAFSASTTSVTEGVNGWQSQGFQQQQQQQQQQVYPDAAANSNTCNAGKQRFFSQPPPTAPEFHLFTFWTACTSCQMRYQYYRKYENQNLLCPQCRRPFIAKDLSSMPGINVTQAWPPPPRAGESVVPGAPHARQSSSQTSAKYESSNPHMFSTYNTSSFKYFNGFVGGGRSDTYQTFAGSKTHTNGTGCAPGAKIDTNFMSHAAGMRATAGDAEKELLKNLKELRRAAAREQAKQKNLQKQFLGAERSREFLANLFTKEVQAQNDACVANKMKAKKSNVDSSGSDSEENRKEGRDECKVYAGQASRFKRSAPYNSNGTRDNLQEVLVGKKAKVEIEIRMSKLDSEADMARRLADIAKNAIRVNLNLQRAKSLAADHAPGPPVLGKRESTPGLASSAPGPTYVKKGSALGSVSVKKESSPCPGSGKRESAIHEECVGRKAKEPVVKDVEVAASCSVPDADFHNFDEGREEKDVEVGQVWALYDDKEGMPKYYMKVKEVRSRTPFKVVIGWFEIRKPSDTVCDLLDAGFSIACGEFRMASTQVMKSVNSFSHPVNWVKSGKGLAKVYPKKGEIWCIYKDWETGQQAVKSGEEPIAYSVVEIVSDCNEGSGAIVMLLKKVEGFKTLFQSSNEPVIHIPFLELLRFSHRVPAHALKGTEAPGIPKGCWELDPAAVPSCLAHPDENAVKAAAAE